MIRGKKDDYRSARLVRLMRGPAAADLLGVALLGSPNEARASLVDGEWGQAQVWDV